MDRRGGQLRRGLLWRIAVAIVVLALLESIATQAALAAVEENGPPQLRDASGRETIESMTDAPATQEEDPLTAPDGVLHYDNGALRAAASMRHQQEHYGSATERSTELHTETSPDRAEESDTSSNSSLSSEAALEDSAVVERQWFEPPPPKNVPSRALPNGSQYSSEGGGRQHDLQEQTTESTTTIPSSIYTDDTGAPYTDDVHAAASPTETATFSSRGVGVTEVSVDAVSERGVSAPVPPPEDLAAPAQSDQLSALDAPAVSTPAWEEGGLSASQPPQAEMQEPYDVPQHPAGEISDSATGVTEVGGACPSALRDRASHTAQTEDRLPLQGDSQEPHEDQQGASAHCDAHTTAQGNPAWKTGDPQQGAVEGAAQQEASSPSTVESTPTALEAPTTWGTLEEELHQARATSVHEGVRGNELSDSVSVPEARGQPASAHHSMYQQCAQDETRANGATHGLGGATADDEVHSGPAGASLEEMRPAEPPAPAVEEATAEENASSAETATHPATVEGPGRTYSPAPHIDNAPSHAVDEAAVVAEQTLAERHVNDTDQDSSDTSMSSEENSKGATYTQPTEGQATGGNVNPDVDIDVIRHGEGAMESEEAAPHFGERSDGTTTAGITVTGEAEGAAREAAVDLDELDDDGLGVNEEQLASSSSASDTIDAPSNSTSPRYRHHEHDALRPQPPPPSRLALSYLYFHALEALYVDENATLFVERARDVEPYGHARLNWLLGVLHTYGVGVPRSERDALMYYSFAAMEAVPEAHMALGYRYKLGLGVTASCESALAHYREAADAVAMTYGGTAASAGGGTEPMTAGAKTVGSSKGERGWPMSFFAYRDDAAVSDMRKQRRLDLISLKYQADMGNVEALLTLGYLLLKGDYQVARDGRRAAACFETAAGKGSARAHGALGQLYMAGDPSTNPPLPPDMQRALHHFRLGALQDDALSLNGIGFLHAIGFLSQDKQHRAPGSDSRNATKVPDEDGEAAASPLKGPPDFSTAAHYFYRSHCAEGLYNLGVLFLHGRGVTADKKQARHLFEKAAKQGSVLAQWQLANMLSEATEDGNTLTTAECERALALYQRTASFGTWQHRAPAHRHSGGGSDVGVDNADVQKQPRRHDQRKKMGVYGDHDAQSWGETNTSRAPSHNGSGSEDDGDAADRLDGFVRPRSEAEYQVLLTGILDRLHAAEESLVSSDEDEGAIPTSLASFVELLSLAETGDAAASWLAVQYVDDHLEVADTGVMNDRHLDKSGAVPLLWPLTSVAGEASQYMSGEAAASELLYYLLQRTVLHHTHTHTTLGAAYLRLGNFFYYGESPQYGVDMERALTYYRVAGDQHHSAQALFNVGFMYQLGLHKAPRVTRVVGGMSAQEVMERAELLRHYTGASVGAEWKVHSSPPEYLQASPAFYLVLKAAANAWNHASTDPMGKGVDIYLAWRYYTASLKQEERGWMAVQFAVAVLNMQWSLRHFRVSWLQPKLESFASLITPPPASADSASSMARAEASEGGVTLSTSAGGAHRAHQDIRDTLSGLLVTLTTALRVVWSYFAENARHASGMMLSWYKPLEDAMLYGAISVVVIGLLVRHHVA